MRSMHRIIACVAFFAGCMICVPQVGANEVTGLGYVDQSAIEALPAFTAAQKQLQAYKADLETEFAKEAPQLKGDAARQQLTQQLSQRLAQRQVELLNPLVARAHEAIAAIAVQRGLSVVVDRRIIIVGGTDITVPVLAAFTGTPPTLKKAASSAPPPMIGYVDEERIDNIPKLKEANARFLVDEQALQKNLQERLSKASSTADRKTLAEDAQTQDGEIRRRDLEPAVDQTRAAIASAAARHGLVLIVDKAALIYGGMDVTSDVAGILE